jgi:hypothetical protein
LDNGFEYPEAFEGFNFRVDDDRFEGITFEQPLNCHDPVLRICFPAEADLGFPFGQDIGEVGLDDYQDLLFLVGKNGGAGVVLAAFLGVVGRVDLFVPPDRGVFLVEVVLLAVVVDGVENVKVPVLEVFPPLGQGRALIDFFSRHSGLL